MNSVSGVICDKHSKIEYLIKDEHKLFSAQKAMSLFDVVDEGSAVKLSNFLETLEDSKSSMNYEINVRMEGKTQSLFFSGLFWMEMYFIQISSDKSEIFFYPFTHKVYEPADAFDSVKEEDTSAEIFNEISRLNNELIDIQRVLAKKNIQLEALNERLEKLATTDSLTGIYNRRAILNRAEIELERASREGRFFSLAILDLDDFKQINDTYGHQVGDEALKHLAECLKESTRKYDSAGRIGGDEFLVFYSLDDSEQFIDILGRLLTEIKKVIIKVNETDTQSFTSSIGGVVVKPGDASEMDFETMIIYADKMLYQAKKDEEKAICFGVIEI